MTECKNYFSSNGFIRHTVCVLCIFFHNVSTAAIAFVIDPLSRLNSARTGEHNVCFIWSNQKGITLRRVYVDENCARRTTCDKRNQTRRSLLPCVECIFREHRETRVHSASLVHKNRRILILRCIRGAVYCSCNKKKTCIRAVRYSDACSTGSLP